MLPGLTCNQIWVLARSILRLKAVPDGPMVVLPFVTFVLFCGLVFLWPFLDNLRLATRIGFRLIPARRCGRVAEGGGLLNR